MGKSILIADGAKNILISLDFIMKKEGFSVQTSTDGLEVEHLIYEQQPDLVLLDAAMPNKSGLDICQQLRRAKNKPHIPVIILSASGRHSDAAKGLAIGADAFISKPFVTQKLISTVHELLEPTP